MEVPGRKTVFIVDDNVDAADMLAQLVRFHGHVAHVSYESSASVALAIALLPDIMIHDIAMPGLNGYEVAKAVRYHPQLTATILIALTALCTAKDRENALLAGFDMHVIKPFDLAQLDEMLCFTRPA